MTWNVHRQTCEGQRAILSFYLDYDFFHGKPTNKGIRYNPVLNRLDIFRPTGERKRAILPFYVDDGFFHWKETKKV